MKSRRSTSMPVPYFAYGSNMDTEQMYRRCPGACIEGPGALEGYHLGFAGKSITWNGPVATLLSGGRCEGMVYMLTRQDLLALDMYEGAPFVYHRKRVTVRMRDGRDLVVWTYIHNSKPATVPPSRAYLNVIARGYESAGLDTSPLNQFIRDRT